MKIYELFVWTIISLPLSRNSQMLLLYLNNKNNLKLDPCHKQIQYVYMQVYVSMYVYAHIDTYFLFYLLRVQEEDTEVSMSTPSLGL